MADTDVAELKDELAAAEARREALLSRLTLLETAYLELEKELARAGLSNRCAPERPSDAHRRFSRQAARFSRQAPIEEPSDPAALVPVIARLAREGHSRDEIATFLGENFCLADVTATVESAFAERPTRSLSKPELARDPTAWQITPR